MLLCSIEDVQPGMVVAAAVLHPRRADTELLSAGFVLDAPIVERLTQLGVPAIWVHHSALEDLDKTLGPQLTSARRVIYNQLREDFRAMEHRTVCAGQIQAYRQCIMELVCELMSNPQFAGLTDHMLSEESNLFTHSANVAYLSLIAGLNLEQYIIRQRARLALEHSRDLTNLGLGAMLHDIGKLGMATSVLQRHEVVSPAQPGEPLILSPDEAELENYHDHTDAGFDMLRHTRAPASATAVILNHHQRWDGSGWPDLRRATSGRRREIPAGDAIHIFPRIVSVANVLDNLMRDADGRHLPPVAALHALAQPTFDGWFDPVVRDAMLRAVPPFPVGSHLKLNNGMDGAVVAPNMNQPCHPVVRLLDEQGCDNDGQFRTISLEHHAKLRITHCAGHRVDHWYFKLSDRRPEPSVA